METLETRGVLAKYNKQRVRFNGTYSTWRHASRGRVIVCIQNVIINDEKVDHIWFNMQTTQFMSDKFFDELDPLASIITGTAEITHYNRRPILTLDPAKRKQTISSSDYGFYDVKKLEIIKE